jgi:hypothetical protein
MNKFDRIAKFEPDRIHCAEQMKCAFYLPWAGPQIFEKFQRENIRCEHLGDDHRCGYCRIGEDCGEHDWVCTHSWNPGKDGRRKRVEVALKEKG